MGRDRMMEIVGLALIVYIVGFIFGYFISKRLKGR